MYCIFKLMLFVEINKNLFPETGVLSSHILFNFFSKQFPINVGKNFYTPEGRARGDLSEIRRRIGPLSPGLGPGGKKLRGLKMDAMI
jgi:hypothetical protein